MESRNHVSHAAKQNSDVIMPDLVGDVSDGIWLLSAFFIRPQ